jgi:hypothetical protein
MTSAGLPPPALLLVLASAMLQASWNVLLARVPRGHDTTAVGLALGLVAWAPLALARWRADGGVWPYALLSAALELAYFAALNLAYTKAPAHAAYPVAHGVQPGTRATQKTVWPNGGLTTRSIARVVGITVRSYILTSLGSG